MRLVLDTHVLIWAVDDPTRLTAPVVAAIQNPSNELLLSAATIWEVAIKVGLGKLSLSSPYLSWMEQAILTLDIVLLPITVSVADVQSRLPPHHGDPFDRLVAAECLAGGLSLLSKDAIFDAYGVTRVW